MYLTRIMSTVYNFASATSRSTIVRKNGVRFISLLKMKDTLKGVLGKSAGYDKPPYGHICQVGDPTLRGRAMKIDPEVIKLADFQKIITHLITVMRNYNACGLAGPQIGLPWQIFAIEYTEKDMKEVHEVVKKVHEMEIVPLQVFINPELKITDYTPILSYESCESIRGFSGSVSRAYEIEITALNTSAEPFTWKARGWPARIVQHEYDHLQGKLYIDKMDMSTFHCTSWEKINQNGGKLHLRYYPTI